LPVLVLLAGKMPALQEILGYFLNWKSLIVNCEFLIVLFPFPKQRLILLYNRVKLTIAHKPHPSRDGKRNSNSHHWTN
jgi:hypothetical protein